MKGTKIPYNKRKQIVSLRHSSMSSRDISKQVGVSEAVVGRYRKAYPPTILGVRTKTICRECNKEVFEWDSKEFCTKGCKKDNKYFKANKERLGKYYTALLNDIQGE